MSRTRLIGVGLVLFLSAFNTTHFLFFLKVFIPLFLILNQFLLFFVKIDVKVGMPSTFLSPLFNIISSANLSDCMMYLLFIWRVNFKIRFGTYVIKIHIYHQLTIVSSYRKQKKHGNKFTMIKQWNELQ